MPLRCHTQLLTLTPHEALSKLYQSIGLDILPTDARYLPLGELEQKIQVLLKEQSKLILHLLLKAPMD